MKIVCAILNPLFKCYNRMIEYGLLKNELFQAVNKELLYRMACLFRRKSKAVFVEDYGTTQRSNKWSKIKYTIDDISKKYLARK